MSGRTAGDVLRAQLAVLRDAANEVRRARWPRSYAFTFVAELGAVLGVLVTLKVAGDVLGSAGFGEYAVARRVISVLTFPLLVGLGTSTARYVSLATGADSPGATATAYSLAALVIAVPIVIAFGLLALTAPAWFAQLFYGEVHYASLTRPIVVAVAGLYAHTLVYANYRGRLRMWVANLLQLWNLGLVPALAVLASGRNVAAAVEITGVAWLTTAIVVACWGAVRAGLGRWTAHAVRSATRDLLRFGLPRVAGEFALFGFFALPTFYVAHTAGVESAGFLSFALSLVQALSSLFSAVGVLLLPYVSRQVGAGNWERVADVVSRSLAASLLVTLVLVAVLHATLGWLIPLVMGQTFALAVGPARWLITGAIPFVTYTLLREPLDGIAVWPYNSVNLVVALAIMLALLWLGRPRIAPGPAVAIGQLLLGALTLFAWRRALARARSAPPAPVAAVPGGSELGV